MSTMFDEAARAAMLARLDRLTPQAPAQWGKMNAPQMIWHLNIQLRDLLGEIRVKPRNMPGLMRHVMRWVAIESPLPWPRGKLPTAPEYAAFDPGDWTMDVTLLKERLAQYIARGQASGGTNHPAFGPLDGRQMGKLLWRHWNHHLTQFGA